MGLMSKSLMREPRKNIVVPTMGSESKPKKGVPDIGFTTDGEAVASAVAVITGAAPFLPPSRAGAIRRHLAALAHRGVLNELVEQRLRVLPDVAREAYVTGVGAGRWAALLGGPRSA